MSGDNSRPTVANTVTKSFKNSSEGRLSSSHLYFTSRLVITDSSLILCCLQSNLVIVLLKSRKTQRRNPAFGSYLDR